MEKRGIKFAVIACFVLILTLAMVSAVVNESKKINMSERRASMNQTRAHLNVSGNMSERISERRAAMTQTKIEANMTYGACVEENAKIKNTCFENRKNLFETCKNITGTNETRVKARLEQCNNNYYGAKDTCKTNFKESKAECSKIKHSFIDSARYFFK